MTADGAPPLADRYLIHHRVAAGDSADVWRATDVMLSRTVAVKILRPELAADGEAVARFRDKAQHAGSVPGGGIIRVYDYNETCPGSPPFMVMEFIEGASLDEILADGPLPPDRTLDIVAQIARTLQDARWAGLAHPDIRPENVLISNDGLVKLTDFGTSRIAGTAPAAGTGDGGQASAADDLYAVGLLAYQCLVGTVPLTETPLALPATFPPEIVALVDELTAKDTAARPDSAGEVARRAAAIKDRMVTVQRPPPPDTQPFAAPAQVDPASPMPVSSLAPVYSRYGRPRQVVLPTVAVAAIVLALFLGRIIDPIRPAAKAPASVTLVDVSGTALRGQPVTVVEAQLRRLGLAVTVRWVVSSAVPPGRVVSVSPTGKVPAGTRITVTGALLHQQTGQQLVRPSGTPTRAALTRPSKSATHPASTASAASSPVASSSPSPPPATASTAPTASVTPAPSGSPSPGPS
ncbi:MAG: protein kinase [Streptosporangiaceae bacterium]|jgi:serine/threonine-protein kinase